MDNVKKLKIPLATMLVQQALMASFVVTLFIIRKDIVGILGGGIIFMLLSFFFISCSVFNKKYIKHLTALSVIAACPFYFNLLQAEFFKKRIPIEFNLFALLFGLCSFIIFICYVILFSLNRERRPEKKALNLGLTERLFMHSWMSLGYIAILSIFLKDVREDLFIPIGVLLLIFSYIMTYVSVKNIDEKIVYSLFDIKKEFNLNIIKYLGVFLAVLFIAGFLFESARGFWFLYIVSFLLIITISLPLWKIWKLSFKEHEPISDDYVLYPLSTIRTEPKRIFVYIGIWSSVGMIIFLTAIYLLK